MAYADLLTVQTLNTGDILTAACLTQIRNNGEFLINPPACSVFKAASVSVANNTLTQLVADSEIFDNDSMHSTSVNTSRITAQTAGRYLAFATVFFDVDADGIRNVKFRVNGTTTYECMQVPAVSATQGCIITGVRAIPMVAGDYFEVLVLHTAGAGLSTLLLEAGATFMTR